jgi:hypothetical protein
MTHVPQTYEPLLVVIARYDEVAYFRILAQLAIICESSHNIQRMVQDVLLERYLLYCIFIKSSGTAKEFQTKCAKS